MSFGQRPLPAPVFTQDRQNPSSDLLDRSGLLRVLTKFSLLHPTRLSKICANLPRYP